MAIEQEKEEMLLLVTCHVGIVYAHAQIGDVEVKVDLDIMVIKKDYGETEPSYSHGLVVLDNKTYLLEEDVKMRDDYFNLANNLVVIVNSFAHHISIVDIKQQNV